HSAAYAHQKAVEADEIGVVGVNRYRIEEPAPRIDAAAFGSLESRQREKLAALRERRDGAAASRGLERVRTAARDGSNLMPPLIEAVRAGATLGEISDVLRAEWGVYRGVAA